MEMERINSLLLTHLLDYINGKLEKGEFFHYDWRNASYYRGESNLA